MIATIGSVGYQGRSVDELIDVLRRGGVELLVDVRLNPISRRPGFSKNPLSEALAEAGIGYRHERALGNPRDNRDPFDRERYEAYLREVGSAVLAEIMDLARSVRIALLCYEREHSDCHRVEVSRVAGAVARLGGGADLFGFIGRRSRQDEISRLLPAAGRSLRDLVLGHAVELVLLA